MTTGIHAEVLLPASAARVATERLRRRPAVSGRAAVAVVLAFALLVLGLQPAVRSAAAGRFGIRWLSSTGGSAKVEPGIDVSSGRSFDVIVQAVPGFEAEARRAIVGASGTVASELPFVHGYQASLTGPQVAQVATSSAVRSVSVDHRVTFEDYTFDETTTASNFAKTSGATSAWAAGNLGAGVGVAVLDTGVSSVRDLDGRLVFGPDLSGEGTTVDTHGHGTVMAGIVGGNGADSAGRTGGSYTGVAPGATVVSVKVAGRNGVVDVSTILQAMHWISSYKDQFNIRVLNLSWGTASTQDPALDPLNYAVQRLWQEGIVVVVAAGNSGPQAGTMMKPGDDPLVVTVGAFDDKQNLDPADDSLPSWSSRGPTAAGLSKPDVVASGRFLTASRSLGSHIEATYPKALVSPSYIRGSGTSEAAAVTSGLAALLVAENPTLTPDQVKAALTRSGSPLPSQPATAQGSGRVQLATARSLAATNPGPAAWQTPTASGLGSIEASRAGSNVETDCEPDGVIDLIRGEIDVRCEAWSPQDWTGTRWTGDSWTGTRWTGSTWTGTRWTGVDWTDATWSGTRWTGGEWTGASWAGITAWTGTRWTGTRWTGTRWTGTRWTGTRWTGTEWTTAEYDSFTSVTYDDVESGFLNAFWGPRPAAGQRIPGEVAEDQVGVRSTGGVRAV